MKILHFYRSMNTGGAETFIMNVYRKIDREKFQFDFLCSSKEKGFYDDEIIKMGGHIYYYNISKNPFITIKNIVKVIKSNGPYEAIHSPMMFFSSIICIAGKICHIKKIIVHSHSASDIKKETTFRKIYIKISRFIINKLATCKMACGLDAAKYLFGTSNDVNICYNGIDFDRFSDDYNDEIKQLKRKYSLENKIIIGEVASFLPVKNHDYYIKLANKLIENKINFVIFLIGEGPLKNSFKEKISKYQLNDYFIILDATNKIPVYMNLFDIYMMPSLYEGFPLSIIEAVSCGNPCLLSNNITSEVKNLGEYIHFFDINSFPNLKLFKKKKCKDNSKIKKMLFDNGFLVDKSIEILESVYGGKYES